MAGYVATKVAGLISNYFNNCPVVTPILFTAALTGLSINAIADSPSPESVTPSPNILIILADDLGWRDVGYHGSEIKTPNIDRIARQGIELDRFYVQPTCSPTRTALMTGKSPKRLGITTPIGKNQKVGLPLDEKILPQYLNEAGYRSLMIGKWHLGHYTPDYFPHQRGFEHFYGYVSGGIGYWDHNQGGGHDWQRNGSTVRETGYATTLLADEAVRLVEAHTTTQPLFMYLALGAPHLPNEAPAASIAEYRHIEREERRIHAAMVSTMDTEIGRVLAAFEEKGLLENTLVMFASDNGGLITGGIPGPIQTLAKLATAIFDRPIPIAGLEFFAANTFDGGSDNSPLRLGKGSVTEGGVRVPAAFWWPGQTLPRRYSGFMTVSDVLPTLLDAIGTPHSQPATLDGSSQWGSLQNGSAATTPDYVVTSFSTEALYRWPWKLIDPEDPELYHIQNDPLEQYNVADEHPQLVQTLVNTVQQWPAAPDAGISLLGALFDMDAFGGEEDRQPWAEAAVEHAQQ